MQGLSFRQNYSMTDRTKTTFHEICDLVGTEIQRINIHIRIKEDGWTDGQNLSDLRRKRGDRDEREREKKTVR